ncbi:Thiamine pyrophosphate-requiring enzymes [hydrothermal vent metagenome]|uniref:Thiamine pyrophosphate-requiring enzymes n=1 Tax=hydrothermal vent metagenome TaxID=652676 RepID=A0A3B0YDP3_9ZZZZ
MKASDLFVNALEKEGVEYIFGIPGEEILDFLGSLRNSSIRFIATRHEQVGAFMAATFGRLTNKTGVSKALLATLENALQAPGVKIIDCPVDYSQNDRLLHKTFQQEAAALEL